MRNFLLLFAAVLLATRSNAQSNTPVRLALIAETGEASIASDLLTVEFSKNPQVQVLDRNDIEKVYREQGLSAANRDYLKLGQVLGADGVLLITKLENQNSAPAISFGRNPPSRLNLKVQLVAVRPGVLLANESFRGIDDVSQWASGLATHLSPLIPKLSVLERDAIPVSIVNLRSAIQSPETKEVERQLTALAIERLSRERQLFVLERSKMQLLIAEKELKGLDDSAFWNGSYLLEGTLDRDGYSPNKITISARLVPPKGGMPVPIEVSGNRANFPAAINQLAEKIRDSLKVAAVAAPWNPADEAQKYFEEAQWALKWGLLEQAQNASDSAWALGKQDQDCAQFRIQSYLAELNTMAVSYGKTDASLSPGFDAAGNPSGPPTSESEVQARIQYELKQHPMGAAYAIKRDDLKSVVSISFAFADSAPNENNLDRAIHLLEMYENFLRTHPEVLQQQTNPKSAGNSKWLGLGIDVLEAASKVLRDFYFAPARQTPVLSKLAKLRGLARTVAQTITEEPSIRNCYFITHRAATRDELFHTLTESRNIFTCELDWGCFWHERPDETLDLYRELLGSAAFCYIHKDFWNRELTQPRLAGWSDEDRRLVPKLWSEFCKELNSSTNVLWQMEAQALLKAEAITTRQERLAETNWWKLVRSHRQELVQNNVELFYDGWGFAKTHETEEMDDEYWGSTVPALKTTFVFEKQKKYFADFTPFHLSEFHSLFLEKNYSKDQAVEIKPLIAAYVSNLVAQATNSARKTEVRSDLFFIATIQKRVDEIINPKPPPANSPQVAAQPATAQTNVATPDNAVSQLGSPTNVLVARVFLQIPKESLPATNLQDLVVFEHRIHENKLLLDVRYRDQWLEHTSNSVTPIERYREAAALWDPHSGWNVTAFPQTKDYLGAGDFMEGSFGHGTRRLFLEMIGDAFYVSDNDAIRRYDLKRKELRELPFPGQDRAELFAINDHLYAASSEGIWEILNDGQSTRIMASTRRRPASSILDSRETLGQPMLFSGPENSLRAAIYGEVFSWDGNDWKRLLAIAKSGVPQISEKTAFFCSGPENQMFEFWRLAAWQDKPVLCLREEERLMPGMVYNAPPVVPNQSSSPVWHSRHGLFLAKATSVLDGLNIYFLIDRSVPPGNHVSSATPVPQHSSDVDLVCLVSNFPSPLTIPLKFDATRGPAPGHKSFVRSTIWGDCSREYLFIGSSEWSGVWTLSMPEIKTELDRQLQQFHVERDIQRKALLAKYDRNRNGIFDPDEMETAITDPAFLELELDNIDADGNENLDVREIKYFDANNDGLLDAPEYEAIRLTQQLLAAKLLKDFDWNENGRMDRDEFVAMLRNRQSAARVFDAFKNTQGNSDVEKLADYLQKTLEQGMSPGLALKPGKPIRQVVMPPEQLSFKQKVESYWARQKPQRVDGGNSSKK